MPYDLLPALPPLVTTDAFAWLRATPPASDGICFDGPVPEDQIRALLQVCEARGVTLPVAFVDFILDANLHRRVPCPAGGDLDLPSTPCHVPSADGFLLRFLSDSQGCLFWYLFVAANGSHCVLVSGEWHGDAAVLSPDEFNPSLHFYCAPDFEHFILRFWIENRLWTRQSTPHLITLVEADYLVAAIAAHPRVPPQR